MSTSKLVLIALVAFGAVFGGCKVYNHLLNEKGHSLSIHRVIGSGEGIKKWSKFDPKDEEFSVRLPSKPKHITKEFPIPRSEDTLPYHEYQCTEGEMVVSVSYTKLPESFMKWGSKIVLSGGMKVIIAELNGAHLTSQESNTFKSFPSLDFEHYLGEQETAGTLVLVKNILYKVEISYPAHARAQVQNKLAQFIESFDPS